MPGLGWSLAEALLATLPAAALPMVMVMVRARLAEEPHNLESVCATSQKTWQTFTQQYQYSLTRSASLEQSAQAKKVQQEDQLA